MEKKISTFETLNTLTSNELKVLASDIRADILSATISNGGHLSSNLGVVELTLSLVKHFSPDDNDILFDVGHQAYTYKILTGRDITKIRLANGLAPFNLREESKYDVYSNGHAGDCISTAIGICKAKMLNHDDSYTIAVVGDASIENGMSFEAIDYIASHKELKNLIIVLNDNGMAISKNRGPISSKFEHLRNSRLYFRTSSNLGKKMSKRKLSWKMFLKMRSFKDHLRNFLLSPTIFEAWSIKYMGPFDGHDFLSLDLAFEKGKLSALKEPVIIHIQTKKGYGYPLASSDSSGDYHGVNKDFDVNKFEKIQSFTSIKEALLYEPMKNNEKIVLITPAMEKGSSLERLFSSFPDRCIDTGISEEHAIVLASGLSIKGFVPIVDIYSTFLQRCYDEIIENVSRNKCKVVFFVERCGLVGEDGSSHHGIYDVSMIKGIPNCDIYMPFDVHSIQYLFLKIKSKDKGALFLRFPKGNPNFDVPSYKMFSNVAFFNKKMNKKLYLGISCMGYDLLKKLDDSFDTGILLSLLPSDSSLNELHLTSYDEIFLYDPYSTIDGTSTVLSDYLIRNNYKGKYKYFSIPKTFVGHGNNQYLYEKLNLDVESVYKCIEGQND